MDMSEQRGTNPRVGWGSAVPAETDSTPAGSFFCDFVICVPLGLALALKPCPQHRAGLRVGSALGAVWAQEGLGALPAAVPGLEQILLCTCRHSPVCQPVPVQLQWLNITTKPKTRPKSTGLWWLWLSPWEPGSPQCSSCFWHTWTVPQFSSTLLLHTGSCCSACSAPLHV